MFGFKIIKQGADTNTSPPSSWWKRVETDRTRISILSGSIIATILLTFYLVFISSYQDLPIVKYSTLVLIFFFFIFSEIIIYRIYNEKVRLETEAWHQLSQLCQPNQSTVIMKFFEVYQDSVLIKHATPFSLVIFELIVAYSTLSIIIELSTDTTLNSNIFTLLLIVSVIISIKLINDIYSLLKNHQKSQALNELFKS